MQNENEKENERQARRLRTMRTRNSTHAIENKAHLFASDRADDCEQRARYGAELVREILRTRPKSGTPRLISHTLRVCEGRQREGPRLSQVKV